MPNIWKNYQLWLNNTTNTIEVDMAYIFSIALVSRQLQDY